MKADDMKEQFQKHLDNLNAEAVDLGAASTAYHMGRKLYKKYKEGGKVVKSLQDLKDAVVNQNKPSGEEGESAQSQPGQEHTMEIKEQIVVEQELIVIYNPD